MILALDPGFSNYGCSVIDPKGKIINLGTIQTQKSKKKLLRVADDDVQRITTLVSGLSNVIHTYNIQGVLAELPPSNSQSAKSAKGLAMAVGLTVSLLTELKIPIEWATPTEVKKAMTGKKNASKEDMMKTACKKFNWKITTKDIFAKKTGRLQRIDKTYHPLGRPMGKNKFEHIADSLGAYMALKNSNVAKMFIKN